MVTHTSFFYLWLPIIHNKIRLFVRAITLKHMHNYYFSTTRYYNLFSCEKNKNKNKKI